jgi:zinc protease
MRSYDAPSHNNAGTLYFIDVPNAKQSVVYVGDIALSATNPDAKKLDFANEILGGGSSGRLFQTLRIGKGYTYGAYSRIPKRMDKAAFIISSSVRANATLASLQIIQQMVQDYGAGFTDKDVILTQNKVIKANTRAFESFGAKLGLLSNISTYSKDLDYVDKEQELLASMTLEDFKTVISKYINENNMVYLVVGDKASQLSEVKKLGKPVIQLDIYGNKI